jgi:hypothetical protein
MLSAPSAPPRTPPPIAGAFYLCLCRAAVRAIAREGDRAGEGGRRAEAAEAAATELDTDVPTSLLQRLCHENGA